MHARHQGHMAFFSLLTQSYLLSLSCFNHQSITPGWLCEWQHLMGHTSFALLKLVFVKGKQHRQALNREITHGDSRARWGEARDEHRCKWSPQPQDSIKSSQCDTNLQLYYCRSPLTPPSPPHPTPPQPRTVATVAAALLHPALSENTVIKKHLTFL